MPINRSPPTSSPTKTGKPLASTSKVLQHSDSAPDLHKVTEQVTNSDRKKRKHTEDESSLTSSIRDMFVTFSKEQDKRFNDLITTVKQIKEQNTELSKGLDLLSCKYDEFLSRIEVLEKVQQEDKKYIQMLEEKIEALERSSRASGLEIRNIPKSTDHTPETKEELCSIIRNLGETLDISIQNTDIKDIFRTGSKDSIKPIITEFSSTILKEKILSAVKKFNQNKPPGEKLNTSHLNLSNCPIKPVYVSESLTQRNQKLFYMTRNLQKDLGYKFCWTSRGVIYIRKSENLPQIRVSSEADLDSLRKKS